MSKRYWVDVLPFEEDSDFFWKKEGKVPPKCGYVESGPVTKMETDFSKLTDAQLAVLKKENEHYRPKGSRGR